jgi:eukaryotic-like serine/threonine-protein kinase
MPKEPEPPADPQDERTAFLFAPSPDGETQIDPESLPKTEPADAQVLPRVPDVDSGETRWMAESSPGPFAQDLAATHRIPDAKPIPPEHSVPRPVSPSRRVAMSGSGPGSWETFGPTGSLESGQTIFGRYTVVRKLGRGGMGTVWLVRHKVLDVERAIKLIASGIAFDPDARARFQREAQAMAQFVHPNAVLVHDARLAEDVAFIDMEYVPGKSLDQILQRGIPMPLDWTARLLEQLCDALETAHGKKIVHRDLKPSNLMLLDGRPPGKEHLKVLDLGIAKILGGDEAVGDLKTHTGAFLGTPPYASPEQTEGHVDSRSDLYSVGVILYEFLTGFRPFSGPRQIADTLNTPPPPFKEVNPTVQVPPAIEQIVLRCLAKEPASRPQTASELWEEFRAALPGGPFIEDVPTGNRTALVVAASVLAFSLAGGGFLVAKFLARPSPPKPDPSVIGSGANTNALKKSLIARQYSLPEGFVAETGTDEVHGWPRFLVCEKDKSRWIRIEGGKFQKGGVAAAGTDPPPSGKLETLPDLYVQETEVTNGQFQKYLDETRAQSPAEWSRVYQKLKDVYGGSDRASLHPAVGISHRVALDYAAWLGASLPTEAEWEYIARSRGRQDRLYVWDSGLPLELNDARANIDSIDGGPSTVTIQVKTRPLDVTTEGVFDLTGNVQEWCRDLARAGQASSGQPSSYRVRGGSWKSPAASFSTTSFEELSEDEELRYVGFRLVLESPPKKPTIGSTDKKR